MTDRKLDALVAEKVMDKFVHTTTHEEVIGTVTHYRESDTELELGRHIPNYSTDIKAVWEVINKVKEDYSMDFYYLKDDKWRIEICKWDHLGEDDYMTIFTGKGFEKTFCCALLQAKGIRYEY